MRNVLTIIKKEMARVFTDKGMIISLFVIPPLTILLIYGLMGMSAENETNKMEDYVPTVYVINAPNQIEAKHTVNEFTDYIYKDLKLVVQDGTRALAPYYKASEENGGIRLINANESEVEALTKKVQNEEADLLIIFPSDFASKIINFENPNITVHYNINNTYSSYTNSNFNAILSAYSDEILVKRLENQNQINVFALNNVGEGNKEKAQGQMISMILPMLIVIYLMAGAMGVGMESIAGEKERGTIATLLVTPIKRSELAIGKIISISIIGLLSSIASFIGLVGVLPTFTKISGGTESSKLSYELIDYLMLLSIMLVAVLMFVALIVIISAYAKSVKQAGTLIMPLYIVVMGAAMFNMFSQTVDKSLTQYAVPVFNIVKALKAMFSFDLGFMQWLVTIISTVVYTIILIFVIQKMFRSEKIMFNK